MVRRRASCRCPCSRRSPRRSSAAGDPRRACRRSRALVEIEGPPSDDVLDLPVDPLRRLEVRAVVEVVAENGFPPSPSIGAIDAGEDRIRVQTSPWEMCPDLRRMAAGAWDGCPAADGEQGPASGVECPSAPDTSPSHGRGCEAPGVPDPSKGRGRDPRAPVVAHSRGPADSVP